jgi:hypothetical protein
LNGGFGKCVVIGRNSCLATRSRPRQSWTERFHQHRVPEETATAPFALARWERVIRLI